MAWSGNLAQPMAYHKDIWLLIVKLAVISLTTERAKGSQGLHVTSLPLFQLPHVENAEWMDDDAKLKLRMALVWHSTLVMKASGLASITGPGKKLPPSASTYGGPDKPATKMCNEFNDNRCFKGQDHPQ